MTTTVQHYALFFSLILFFGCVQSGTKHEKSDPPFENVPKVQNAKVSSVDDALDCSTSGGDCVQIFSDSGSSFTICFEVLNATEKPIVLNSASVVFYEGNAADNPIVLNSCEGSIAVGHTLMPGRDTIITRSFCAPSIHLFDSTAQVGFNLNYNGQIDSTFILNRCNK